MIANDGWYFEEYGGEEDAFGTRDYMGFYKVYFDSGEVKKITNDNISSACICGSYLYYYINDKTLCRMGIDGGNWEDVSWMIQ